MSWEQFCEEKTMHKNGGQHGASGKPCDLSATYDLTRSCAHWRAAARNISHPRSGQGSDDDSIRWQEECWDVQVGKTLEGTSDHFSCFRSQHSGTDLGFFVLSQSVLSEEDGKKQLRWKIKKKYERVEQVTAIISNIAEVRLQQRLFRSHRCNKTLKRVKETSSQELLD